MQTYVKYIQSTLEATLQDIKGFLHLIRYCCPVVVVWLTIILATSGNGEIYDGYSPFLDSEVDENEPPVQLGEAAMVSRDDQGFECPSPNVITTRYRCKVMWIEKYLKKRVALQGIQGTKR